MSQENVGVLRAVYEDWGKGDFRPVVDLLDRDFLLVLRPEFPEAGRYLGVEGLADFFRSFLSAWETVTMTAEEFIEAGDSVLVAVRQSGVGAGSGAPIEMAYFHAWTFRGPKVIRLENIRSRAQALEAVGLRE